MAKKRGLGKGLAALLGEELDSLQDKAGGESRVLQVAIELLRPNPYQPRKQFDSASIDALAQSIAQHGILQPIAVRESEDGFEIIAGERRFRAAKQIGLTSIPVVIHDISDSDSAALALVENVQREDLNVIEKAQALTQLIEQFGLTHEQCGRLLGESRAAISNTLRLLKLSQPVQEAVVAGQIEMGHARSLLSVDNATQHTLLQQIMLQGLTVRETEALIAQQSTEKPRKKPQSKSIAIQMIEQELSEALGCRVRIDKNTQKGPRVTLYTRDEDMFNQLIQKIKANN